MCAYKCECFFCRSILSLLSSVVVAVVDGANKYTLKTTGVPLIFFSSDSYIRIVWATAAVAVDATCIAACHDVMGVFSLAFVEAKTELYFLSTTSSV